MDEKRKRRRVAQGWAQRKTGFTELAKYVVRGTQNVCESPCVISEEHHDEFDLVDIMDHLLALIGKDEKK